MRIEETSVTTKFRVEVGNKLALMPPMGWKRWYIYYHHGTEAAMRRTADQMIASGMTDFGYAAASRSPRWGLRVSC